MTKQICFAGSISAEHAGAPMLSIDWSETLTSSRLASVVRPHACELTSAKLAFVPDENAPTPISPLTMLCQDALAGSGNAGVHSAPGETSMMLFGKQPGVTALVESPASTLGPVRRAGNDASCSFN